MKTLHYFIIVILIFSTLLYLKPIQADNANGIEIQNIQTLPSSIIVGQTFKINATLINISSNPILVEHGSCESPFSVTFDNHVLISTNNITCTTEMVLQKLNPGEELTATSPNLDLVYRAAKNGTANGTITSSYETWNQTIQSNSKKTVSVPFSFTIYGKTRVPILSPSGNQALIDVALAIPGLQKWSNDWQYVSMGFMTAKNQPGNWQYAIVNLKASSSSSLIPCDNNNEDWSAMVMIDRTTMKVIQATYPTLESHNCSYATGGGPASYGGTISKIDAPLEQFKSGVAAKDVKCGVDLNLVIKSKDSSPACIKKISMERLVRQGWWAWNDKVGNTIVNTPEKKDFDSKNCGLLDTASSIVGTNGFGRDDLPQDGITYPRENITGLVGQIIQFSIKPNSEGYITFAYDFNPYPGSNCKVTTKDAIGASNHSKPNISISELIGSPDILKVDENSVNTSIPPLGNSGDILVNLTSAENLNDHVTKVTYKIFAKPDAQLGKSYFIGFWWHSAIAVTVGNDLYNGTAFSGPRFG